MTKIVGFLWSLSRISCANLYSGYSCKAEFILCVYPTLEINFELLEMYLA